jgi:hypothetical protein
MKNRSYVLSASHRPVPVGDRFSPRSSDLFRITILLHCFGPEGPKCVES